RGDEASVFRGPSWRIRAGRAVALDAARKRPEIGVHVLGPVHRPAGDDGTVIAELDGARAGERRPHAGGDEAESRDNRREPANTRRDHSHALQQRVRWATRYGGHTLAAKSLISLVGQRDSNTRIASR